MISTIISAVSSKVIALEKQKTAAAEENTLNIDEMNSSSLRGFLTKFAPIQLLANRETTRIILSVKILDILSHLHTAHSLLQLVNDKTPSSGSITSDSHQKLKSRLAFQKISAIPHRLWNSNHDITLIGAIVKHGWIGREDNCRFMNEDKEIKWGAPFEEIDHNNDDSEVTKVTDTDNKENMNITIEKMTKVARRAVAFLNSHQYVTSEVKSFDLELVSQTFGIVKEEKSSMNQTQILWRFEESRLQKQFNETKSGGEQLAELPTRRDLLRRARALLSKARVLIPNSKEVIDNSSAQQEAESYSILDQSNSCNLFLAELLRAIKKNDQKGRKYSKSLLNVAIAEANDRLAEESKGSSADGPETEKADTEEVNNLRNICDHLKFVSRHLNQLRQSKNVLRVILGLPPVKPKGSSDNSVFPLERPNTLKLNKSPKSNIKEASKPKSAVGDQAISKGISVMRSRKIKSSLNKNEKKTSLKLTSIETLLVSVICSQGIPVFHSSWEMLVNEGQSSTEGNFAGEEFQINWYLMGHVIETAAKEWLSISTKKFEQLAQIMTGQKTQSDQLRRANEDVATKKRTLREAEILRQSPKRLAQKCIMLMEALSVRMGLIEIPTGNDSINTNALEYGLGPHVLQVSY